MTQAALSNKEKRTQKFLILLLMTTALVTAHLNVINVKQVANKRLDVTAQDVVTQFTHSSKISCAVACVSTSWCVSANLAPDRSTCQLLSEEVSQEASLESADGWTYICKLQQSILTINFKQDT